MSNDLYVSAAFLGCFDGETTEVETPTGDPSQAAVEAKFTQEQVNKFVAEEKRKSQAVLVKQEQAWKEQLANNKSMSESDRKTLEENLNTLSGQLRSKEAQLAHEKKELEATYNIKLNEAELKAKRWEEQYRDSTISRSLQDAAVTNDAFQPSQIVTLLKPMTKLVEVVDEKTSRPTGQFRPMVELEDTDPTTGQKVMTSRTPDEAVKRMKEMPESFGNLFRGNVVSGIGSNSTAGIAAGGKVDLRKIASNPEQYRELREKNPEILGLRPRRAGGR